MDPKGVQMGELHSAHTGACAVPLMLWGEPVGEPYSAHTGAYDVPLGL